MGLADLQDWWQLWQEQQGQVLAALVAHLGQPLDSWDPPLVAQVQRLGRQHLTTLQEDLPGLSSLADLAAWCEQGINVRRDALFKRRVSNQCSGARQIELNQAGVVLLKPLVGLLNAGF